MNSSCLLFSKMLFLEKCLYIFWAKKIANALWPLNEINKSITGKEDNKPRIIVRTLTYTVIF